MRRPLPSHAPHHLHHPRQIGLAHGGAGGQAQPIAEQRLGHTSPLPRREGPGEGHLAIPEHRHAGAWASTDRPPPAPAPPPGRPYESCHCPTSGI